MISDAARLLPLLLVVLLAAGCDTESLLSTEPTDRANRAAAILGSDANMIAHLNVPALLEDARMLENALPDTQLPEGGLDQVVQSWAIATGINVQEDVSSVVLGAFIGNGGEPQTGVVVYVDIDIEDLIDRLSDEETSLSLVTEGTTSVIYADGGTRAVGAFLEEGILLGASDEARLFNMLSRAEAGDTSFFTSGPRISRVLDKSAWVVISDVPAMLAQAQLPPDAELATTLLSTLESVVIGAGGDGDVFKVNAYLEPRADITASDLADLLRGAISITRAQSEDEDLIHLLDLIGVDHDNGIVEVDIELNDESLQIIFSTMGEAFKADVFEPRNPSVH